MTTEGEANGEGAAREPRAANELANAVRRRIFGPYNPLYAFSALCIIAGVYLVGSELEHTAGGRVLLAVVLELYGALLIAGAAVLRRAAQPRAAASLGLLAAFFLVDPTLRVEGIVTSDDVAVAALSLWGLLALAKLQLLSRVFALRLRALALLPIGAALLSVAVVPWLMRALPADREQLALGVSFCGALLIAITALQSLRPQLAPGATASARVVALTQRSLRAVQWLAVLGYHYHGAITLHAHEVPFGMLLCVPYLALLPALAGDERKVWQLAVVALLPVATSPLTLAPTALLVCAAFVAQYQRRGLPRLLIGAALTAYLGLWMGSAPSYAALSVPELWLQAVGAALLFALAWRLRLWRALVAAALCLSPSLRASGATDPLHLGIAVLVVGFAALAIGIWRDAHSTSDG